MRLLALICVPLLSGCFLKNLVYHPVLVTNAVGDSTTTIGGMKVHVYARREFVVYGPTVASVSAAEGQASRAYREFHRYFDGDAPPLEIVLATDSTTLPPADASRVRRSGVSSLVYVRPRDYLRVEGVDQDLPREAVWPIAAPIARTLLDAYARIHRHEPPAADTVRTLELARVRPFPMWFLAAVTAILGDPGAPDRAEEYLHDHIGGAPSLRDVLEARYDDTTFAAGVTTIDAARERRRLLAAEGIAFVVFAAEREGARVVRRMANAFLDGQTALDALHDARHLPHDPDRLERLFRAWLREDVAGR